MCARDCTDDRNGATIVSASFDEKAVLNEIGKIGKIDRFLSFFLQFAIEDDEKAESYLFTKIHLPLKTMQSLLFGPLHLENLSFLSVNAELLSEDLLISCTVL